jgi:hypothetical protein
MEFYLSNLSKIVGFCEEFKREILESTFTEKGSFVETTKDYYYCWMPKYQSYWKPLYGIVDMCDMLGIENLEINKSDLIDHVVCLNNPIAIQRRNDFEYNLDWIKEGFKDTENEIVNKIRLLEVEEKNRLNEALNCYMEGCNYSAIAMAVSALEFRLFSLMMSKCPDSKLEEFTLGQLIREYLDNKEKYGKGIPKKHEPLLEHCNVYRVFSVHPKREKITRSIATSIISMTFAFLLDENLKQRAEMKR